MSDIATVALGFAGKSHATSNAVDSAPFVILKESLNEVSCGRAPIVFDRQWSINAEANSGGARPDDGLFTTFNRFDVFVTAWTTCLGALVNPLCRQRQRRGDAMPPYLERLADAMPTTMNTLRLWATSLPQVLAASRTSQGLRSPSKSQVSNSSFGSKAAGLKFTVATLTVPIDRLAPIGSPSCDGDGTDFIKSRVIRLDVLKSAINEVALVLVGGGAAPSEASAMDASVTGTTTYQNSVGVVGFQVSYVTSKKGSDSAFDLELQFLTQSSTSAGKTAIEMSLRELLPSAFFESPSTLSIGVANLQDGSVSNVTVRSPALAPAQVPKEECAPPPPPTSWSALITRGSTKDAIPPSKLAASKSLPMNTSADAPKDKEKDANRRKATATKSLEVHSAAAAVPPVTSKKSDERSSSKKAPSKAPSKDTSSDTPTVRVGELKATDNAGSTADGEGNSPQLAAEEKGSNPSPAPAPQQPTSEFDVSLEVELTNQAKLLQMHARDVFAMHCRHKELVGEPVSPSSSPTSSPTAGQQFSPKRFARESQFLLPNHKELHSELTAFAFYATESYYRVLVSPSEAAAMLSPSFESTVGPDSKMLKATLQADNKERTRQYREFQQAQKNCLHAALSAYGMYFHVLEDTVKGSLDAIVGVLHAEHEGWISLLSEFERVSSMLAKSTVAQPVVVSPVEPHVPHNAVAKKKQTPEPTRPEQSLPCDASELKTSPAIPSEVETKRTSVSEERKTESQRKGASGKTEGGKTKTMQAPPKQPAAAAVAAATVTANTNTLPPTPKEKSPQLKKQQEFRNKMIFMLIAFAIAIVAAALYA